MTDYKIKEGYKVPILGEPRKETGNLSHPPFVGVCPVEFPGLKPKLAVKVDDEVKVGTPLFFDKKAPAIQFGSPASGRITAINYGPRRVIDEIIITTSSSYDYESYPKYSAGEIGKLDRAELIEQLMKGCMWPFIRKRPFNKIASPDDAPKAVFVNCMDTAPLAGDPAYALKDQGEAFKAGVAAMEVLCPTVHVCAAAGADNAPFQGAGNFHTFSGKHPAGLTGTHISRISPINKGESVWCLNARDAVRIGRFLLEGRYPIEQIVAVAGPGATSPQYYKAQLGMKIKDIVGNNVTDGEQRFVSGNILAGTAKTTEGYLGFYDNLISILPEGRNQRFLGWMMPGGVQSYGRSYTTGFFSSLFKMDTNQNGGHRAIIASGLYEEVVALDLHPEFLLKATMAQDIDAMEQLGILECDPEDFALCTYLCPSKTEVSGIIAEGLELMEKEG